MAFRHFRISLLCVATALAQERPIEVPQHTEYSQQTGFMREGMHHVVAKGVKLEIKSDAAAHVFTVRIGPMSLPARTPHTKMPQPPDLVWTLPVSGWLLAYHPKLVAADGASVAGTVLHHVAFWNENRSDFLCPNKEEHIFGAGGELTDWAPIPGYGYRVEKDDRIRLETMIHNLTETSYDKAYLEITIPYLDDHSNPAPIKNYYPAWMDVGGCDQSGYDLPTGPSEKAGSVTMKYSGVLLGVGGHMHDYAKQLVLEDSRSKEPVVVLHARVDLQGHLLSMPVSLFSQTGGYALAAGDKLTITASYDNISGKVLPEGAMGIVVGYFVPEGDTAAFAALRHSARLEPHAMGRMSHDVH